MDAALDIRSLAYEYPDGSAALAGVDLVLKPGERVALLGPNGAGKSTLIAHMNGVFMPQSGSVAVNGLELRRDTLAEIRRAVGLVFQDPDDQLFMMTVYDDVAFGPLNMGLPREEVDARVHAALHAVGLPDVASKPGMHLSFGQKKRVALATVLSMRPSILVLDEPTSNLDPRSAREMSQLLASLDSTMVLATHDMDLAWRLCERAVVLDGGRVIADGPADRIMADEQLMLEHGLALPFALQAEGRPGAGPEDRAGHSAGRIRS